MKLPLERQLEIGEAIVLVEGNQYLDGIVSYRLGRLGDKLKSTMRTYKKERERINEEKRVKVKEVRDKVKQEQSADSQREGLIELNEIQIEFDKKLSDLLYYDQAEDKVQEQDEIEVPKFKLSDFIAKYDITNEKIAIKTGQTLVPVRFFTLMGDLIEDDKKAF